MVNKMVLFKREFPASFSSKLSGLVGLENRCVFLIANLTSPVFIVGLEAVSPLVVSEVVVVVVLPFSSLMIFTSFSTVLFSEQATANKTIMVSDKRFFMVGSFGC